MGEHAFYLRLCCGRPCYHEHQRRSVFFIAGQQRKLKLALNLMQIQIEVTDSDDYEILQMQDCREQS